MKISWWTPKYPTNMRCHQRYSFRVPKISLPNLDELPYFPAWFPVFLCSLLCSHFLLWSCNTLSLTRTLGVSWREEEFPEWSCALFCGRMQICWLFLVTCLTQMILTDWPLSKPYSMLTSASVFDQKHPLMKGLHKMFVVYLCCTCNQQSFAMAVVVDVVLIVVPYSSFKVVHVLITKIYFSLPFVS